LNKRREQFIKERLSGGRIFDKETGNHSCRLWRDMAKAADAITTDEQNPQEGGSQKIDSKYRLILVAAQRSKQIQRGARPRVEMDIARHKPTRIALEEVLRGKVDFSILEKE
jgi:DNA-directed RNA polymerase omega subunit